MLKIGVIGIGNAGNQVADLAHKSFGIKGIALNSSEKDISNVRSVDGLVIGDEKGAGKDRNVAKKFIQGEAKALLNQEKFVNVIMDSDLIFVVSSTGGGTGSGMSPVFTDVLSRVYPMKKFILIGILPPLKESVAAQQNTIEYLKEINSGSSTYMLYDNNNYTHETTDAMMKTVNQEIVEDMLVIQGEYQMPTQYNSIDEKDMMKITQTYGRIVIARTAGMKEKDIDEKGIEERLVTVIKNNAHAELDRDQIVKRLGLIVNLNEKLNKTLDSNLPTVKDLIGEPIEGFEHIHLSEADGYTNRVIAIASGLSVPDDRITKIIQRIDDVQEALTKVKTSSVLDDTSVDILNDLRTTQETGGDVAPKEVNLDDIFGSYIK